MLKPYELLDNLLIDIEKGINEDINVDNLSQKYSLSNRHLRRIFSFAFNQTLSDYIRSRRLTASLDDLLKTDSNVLDIALDYGFGYEQTYIRAFKREFGITPGDMRKSNHIVKVKPPILLFDENKVGDSVLFGPEIVMVPQFHTVGKYLAHFSNINAATPKEALEFLENESMSIKNVVNHKVYIGLHRVYGEKDEWLDYIPSKQVTTLENAPPEFYHYTFEASLCVRFRYIGQHHYTGFDDIVAKDVDARIDRFRSDERIGYVSPTSFKEFFIKTDISLYDETYCIYEFFFPVQEKRKT